MGQTVKRNPKAPRQQPARVATERDATDGLRRSMPGLDPRAGANRGSSLPELQGPGLRGRLPSAYRYQEFHRVDGRG